MTNPETDRQTDTMLDAEQAPPKIDALSLPPAERAQRRPAWRRPIHTRAIQVNGYERSDELWDIVAELTDTKTYGIDSHDRGYIEPGEAIHDMRITVTLSEDYEILAILAETLSGPFTLCPAITPNFQRLVGLKIGPGWMREVKARVGGIAGCTHLVELLPVLATAAMQTMGPIVSRKQRERREAAGEPAPPPRRPGLLNTCHAWAETSPVVARVYPDWHKPADGDA